MRKILRAPVLVGFGTVLAMLVGCSRSDTVVIERSIGDVPIIEISGILDSSGARTIVGALHRAESAQPAMILIQFDSPGGAVAGTLDVAEAIKSSPIKTVGFVKDAVAGTVFMIAAVDRIYFSPQGVCGAASLIVPATSSESDSAFLKVAEQLRLKLKIFAEAKGHDSDVFSAMTDPSSELVRCGKVWKERGQVLSLTASEAQEIGLSCGTAVTPDEAIAMEKKRANQALLPTPMSVTDRANARSAPATGAADL